MGTQGDTLNLEQVKKCFHVCKKEEVPVTLLATVPIFWGEKSFSTIVDFWWVYFRERNNRKSYCENRNSSNYRI